ncbi:MAG: hypothetical protein AAF363_07935 [Bacteroidota bacterium]
MRLKSVYRTKLNIDDLNRNIGRNMSPEPGFSGNDFTYFFELNNALKTTKALWFNIPYKNKVNIKSNSVFYWPRTEVNFNSTKSETLVTVHFIGATLAYFGYGLLLTAIIGMMTFLYIKNPTDTSPILAAFVFSLALSVIPFLGRKIQNNIVSRLFYS